MLGTAEEILLSIGLRVSHRDGGLFLPFLIGAERVVAVTVTAPGEEELRIRAAGVLKGTPAGAGRLNATLRGGLRCIAGEAGMLDLLCDLPGYVCTSDLLGRGIAETLMRIYLIAEAGTERC